MTAILSLGVALGASAQSAGTAGSSGSTATTDTAGSKAGSTATGATGGTSSSGSATTGSGSGTATSKSASGKSADTSATGSGATAKLDRGDRKFLTEAAMGGLAEVQLGQLAQQKASNDQVKQFAQRMAQDHGKANEQLKQTVSAKGMDLPTSLDGKHKKEMDRLSKLSGAEFDREYMKHMVSDHKKDVKDFEKASKSSKDSDIKSFASTTLPTLQEHLQMAQTVNDSVKGGRKTAAAGAGDTSSSTGRTGASTSGSGTGSTTSGGTGSSSSTGTGGTSR